MSLVGKRVKLSYSHAGAPVGATWLVLSEDACHYFVAPIIDKWDQASVRIPKRCAILPEDFHLTH
jgi:hypothetical protein